MILDIILSAAVWATAWVAVAFVLYWLSRAAGRLLSGPLTPDDDDMAVASALPCCPGGHLHPARERIATPAGDCGCMWLTEAGEPVWVPCPPHSIATPDFAEWQREFDRQNGASQ